MNYKVSVIVPVYNVEKYINRCLNSLVNQTLKEVEIVIVNDGSTDNSHIIVKDYMKKYNNIMYYEKENGGLSDARNYGLEKASGEYVMFVDSDDYIDLEACERLYNNAKKNKVDVIIGNYYNDNDGVIKKNINNIDEKIYEKNDFIKEYYSQKKVPVMSWLLFINRLFMINNKLLFKKGYLHEDEDFMPHLLYYAHKIQYLDYSFYYYVFNSQSITNKKDKSKNINDIYKIALDLDKFYLKFNDKKVQKLFFDRNTYIRLTAFVKMKKFDKKYLLDKKLILGKACKKATIIKTILYSISPRLYYFFMIIKNR